MKQRVTMDDVARAANVSKQTVSRAINNKGDISPQTKDYILKIINELGYRPSRMAQAMNTQRSYMVGFVIPDIANPFFAEVARGVQDAAMAANYSMLLCNTDNNPAQAAAAFELMAAQGVDGIIAFGFAGAEEQFERFADTFRPIVFINSFYQHKNVSRLIVRNEDGVRMAVDYLVETGHKHIGMLSTNSGEESPVRREQGFVAALEQHGLAFRADQIEYVTPQLEGGFLGIQRLLKARPEITAVFTYNDVIGLGAMRALADMNKVVPDDVAIIGFDDLKLGQMASPSLSSVRVDKHALGTLALERVLTMIERPGDTLADLYVDVDLVHRESTQI